jgi:hypothetical protein
MSLLKSKKVLLISLAVIFFTAIIVIAVIVIQNKADIKKEREQLNTDFNALLPIINQSIVLFTNSDINIVNGEIVKGDKPFVKDGTTFVSTNYISELFNAQLNMNSQAKMHTLSNKSNTAMFMTGLNIVLFKEPLVIQSAPIEKNGEVYLPIDTLAKILNLSFFRDYNQEVLVINATKPLSAEQYITLRKYAGLKVNPKQRIKELDAILEIDKDAYIHAYEEKLFVSNKNGDIYKWHLLDDFSLEKEKQEIEFEFPADTVFFLGEVANADKLYYANTKEYYSPSPQKIINNSIMQATENYVIDKVNNDIGIEINFNKNITKENSENDWKRLCQTAKIGDILLFKNSQGGAYGYFTHSALIIDIDINTFSISVLQARNAERGVGSGLPVDTITFEKFYNDDYWGKNYTVLLCSVLNVSEDTKKIITTKAIEHFNGYEFGYIGFTEAKQTTCSELIRDAYKLQNIEIVGTLDYTTALKSVLSGDYASLILVPEDLLRSEDIEVKDFWLKGN